MTNEKPRINNKFLWNPEDITILKRKKSKKNTEILKSILRNKFLGRILIEN